MKIFIADDSAVIRERLISLLSECPGIEIIGQAQDAAETMKLLETLNPDVVILDIRMPGESGIEVLRNIKQCKQAPKVIMLTNYPYPQYRDKCLELGADYFFDKSTEFNKIPEILASMNTASPAD
ncbi:MAG: response regulator transcription factor [bacterium]